MPLPTLKLMSHEPERRSILQDYGFSQTVVEMLLTVLARDVPAHDPPWERAHLGNEIFVLDWIAAVDEARRLGALGALRRILFELNFPIETGISRTPLYQELALAGGKDVSAVQHRLPDGPSWENEGGFRFFLHESGIGLIPVLLPGARADFLTLIRAIVHQGEPRDIPPSAGSMFINGYRNRRRYLLVRHALASGVLQPEWRDPQLWRDKFIIVSDGPYSGVSHETAGYHEGEWAKVSLRIRIEHESTHYVARRLFPRLKFGLQDELIADFSGLMQATGQFSATTFLTFMGLEHFPAYRPGGRFENYQKELRVSPESFLAVGWLLCEAARHLEAGVAGWPLGRWELQKVRLVALLTRSSLEEMAAGNCQSFFQDPA